MAKSPDSRKGKDPARPTRAKAAREPRAPIAPALEQLLNPGIAKGTAGVGSQTGLTERADAPKRPGGPLPGGENLKEKSPETGLRPPADNSWDRHEDFSAAHGARKSTREAQTSTLLPNPPPSPSLPSPASGGGIGRGQAGEGDERPGFAESAQAAYTSDAELIEASPELARALGLDGDAVPSPEPQFERRKRERLPMARGDITQMGVAATAASLDALLREGRAEFKGAVAWRPHRPEPPDKSDGGRRLVIKSDFEPQGDQPTAIKELVEGVRRHDRNQVLLGVTGSGKTFTMAKVIEATQRPALILAPNKTLAAQLYGEFRSFFPDNAVEYFVSYYDYYQPEAYVPRTDTYIEKESSINEQIDRMRHSATRALLERDDVIIVASVSCIYGIGSVETYSAMTQTITVGKPIDRAKLLKGFVEMQYRRNDTNFERGTFRVRGDSIELFPAHYEDRAWRVNLFGDTVENIEEFDPLTGHKQDELEFIKIYANSHYVTPRPTLVQAIKSIKSELKLRLDELNNQGRLLEAQRLEQRPTFHPERMEATGSGAGIENYSRYLTGRRPGEPPPPSNSSRPTNCRAAP